MALAPGFIGPIHVCRRLFGEVNPTCVQQALETMILKDTERFTKIWNFPPFSNTSEERQPLSVLNATQPGSDTRRGETVSSTRNGWRLVHPEASFYITPPRRLKARRRLTPSVAEKTKYEVMQKTVSRNLEDVFHTSKNQILLQLAKDTKSIETQFADLLHSFRDQAKMEEPTLTSDPETPGEGCLTKPPVAEIVDQFKPPLISTPEASTHPCASIQNHRLIIARPARFSEQTAKRKINARVTAYLANGVLLNEIFSGYGCEADGQADRKQHIN
ncbi:hypothetical protein X801_10843 [Opisthorchis viverrini]|uniref:Uncharacterized protein n=2 Tax=Opisthorchis viverrini TaxID=6198 RepID=A0A1S8WG10_OPIVI|nr:hypothetical protein T265_09062 [Opisthorchis viverrini]KER22929.1 hypothetical protein T265_09062 [Opisthorchis viverrini]OON13382.1 hypothetical protein X801_10843 [Opisthorchis viverrini]